MRTTERLRKLKKWVTDELCRGRMLKAPAADMELDGITRQEPKCYLVWAPQRNDRTGLIYPDPVNVCPGIMIMLNLSKGKLMEEKRFDRYNKVSRPKELGQTLAVSILMCIYEPGVRLPGFHEHIEMTGEVDMSLIMEGTEEGLFTLLDWMDDLKEKLLGEKNIPGTDMFLDEESLYYSMYTDQAYVVDKRPLYYGFVNCEFYCHADEGVNRSVDEILN